MTLSQELGISEDRMEAMPKMFRPILDLVFQGQPTIADILKAILDQTTDPKEVAMLSFKAAEIILSPPDLG